jgi:hypothetical protein
MERIRKSNRIKINPIKIANKDNKSLLYEIFSSIKVGIAAFCIILALVCITKLIAFSINSTNGFDLGIVDFIISFWGFIIFSFIIFVNESDIS